MFWRNSPTPLSMNFFSLSKVRVFGISNQKAMFFQMNFKTLVTKIVAIGSTSIHFVNWSMLTRRNLLVLLLVEKVHVCLLPKWQKAMVLLCYAILLVVSEICYQTSGILHILSAVLPHHWQVVFDPKYSGGHWSQSRVYSTYCSMQLIQHILGLLLS